MPEWQVTFIDGSFENFNYDRLFITPPGVLVFTDVEQKRHVVGLSFAPGEWKKVERVDAEGLESEVSQPEQKDCSVSLG